MGRRLLLLLVAMLLVLTIGVMVVIQEPVASEPVYTVAQMQAILVRYHSAWVGRTVLVRGRVVGAAWKITIPGIKPMISPAYVNPQCYHDQAAVCPSPLADPLYRLYRAQSGNSIHLVLAAYEYPQPGPLLYVSPPSGRLLGTAPDGSILIDVAQHLPFLSAILEPKHVQWGAYTLYRLHILPPKPTRCGMPGPTWPSACDDAALVW